MIILIIFVVALNISYGLEVVCTVTYNSPVNGDEEITDIVLDDSDNVYAVGREGDATGYERIWLRKYDNNTNVIWTKTYNGAYIGDDIAIDATFDKTTQHLYVVGTIINSFGRLFDWWIGKFNVDGVEVWVSTYNGVRNLVDMAAGVELEPSGNMVIAGFENWNPFLQRNSNALLRKYTPEGSLLWSSTFSARYSLGAHAASLCIDSLNNIYVVGGESTTTQGYDLWLAKYNSAGELLGVTYYNGESNGDDYPLAVKLDKVGNIIVCGTSFRTGEGKNITVWKYTPDLQLVWVKEYNGPGNGDDEGCDIYIDKDNSFLVTGYATVATGKQDMYIGKFNSDGTNQWHYFYDNSSDIERLQAITRDSLGYILAAGHFYSSLTRYDVWIGKFKEALPTYSIKGYVKDAQGVGIGGVTMNLTGTVSKTTVTASSGYYEFTGLASGNYTVTPTKTGYSFSPVSRSTTSLSGNIDNWDFIGTAVETGTLSGKITRTDKQTPLANATVELLQNGIVKFSTSTKLDGTYILERIPVGKYDIKITIKGYEPKVIPNITVQAAGTVEEAELRSVHTINVRDKFGQPISGAKVVHLRARPKWYITIGDKTDVIIFPRQSAITDGAGKAVLYDIYPLDVLLCYDTTPIETKYLKKGDANRPLYKVYRCNNFREGKKITEIVNEYTITIGDEKFIAVDLIVSTEFRMDQSYAETLYDKILDASVFLFDATDGQMMFGDIEIYDNQRNWDIADIRIYGKKFREYVEARMIDGIPIFGLTRKNFSINLHSVIEEISGFPQHIIHYQDLAKLDIDLRKYPITGNRDVFGYVILHEFGHYAFKLLDEYISKDGRASRCTKTRKGGFDGYWTDACVMDNHHLATEFCGISTEHVHNTDTWQHQVHGKSCWDTIATLPEFSPHIKKPESVNIGPFIDTELFVTKLKTKSISGAGHPTVNIVVKDKNTKELINDANVFHIHGDTHRIIPWGRSYLIRGVNNGDKIKVIRQNYAPKEIIVNNNVLVFEIEKTATPDIQYVTVTYDREHKQFIVEVVIKNLKVEPIITLIQDETLRHTKVATKISPDKYRAVFPADIDHPLNVDLEISGTKIDDVSFSYWASAMGIEVLSGDDNLAIFGRLNTEVFLPEGAINQNTFLNANTTALPEARPGPYYFLIGEPVNICLTHSQHLNRNISITMYYPPGTPIDDLAVYRLDENSNRWLKLPSEINKERCSVTAQTSQLSVFAMFGRLSTLAPTLEHARCYPNPFKPYKGHTKVTFVGLPSYTHLRVYTISGELVYEVQKETPLGYLEWDCTNNSGEDLASGIYIYYITSGTLKPKKGKLVIIR